ncbi:hypothetical protein BDW75DRAFT_234627 [Aspergillus navahoensis]
MSLVYSYRLQSICISTHSSRVGIQSNKPLIMARQRLPSDVHHIPTIICPCIRLSWPQNTISHGFCSIPCGGQVLLTDVVGVKKRGYYQSMDYVVYGLDLDPPLEAFWLRDLGGVWYTRSAQIPFASTALFFLVFTISSNTRLRSIDSLSSSSNQINLHNYDWWGSVLLLVSLTVLFAFLTTGGNVLAWSHPIVITLGTSLILTTRQDYVPHNTLLPIRAPRIPPTSQSAPHHPLHLIHDNQRHHGFAPSQILLTSGTLGLFLAAALTSARSRMNEVVYNLVLVFPTLGVGMMAPSVVLTLLNSCTREDHAVSNGCFIMMRSLGAFTAVALGTTTLQNSFESSISRERGLHEQEREMIQASRQQVELVPTLTDSVRSKVIDAYSTGFTILFGLCFLLALLIVFSLRGIQVRELDDGPYGKQMPSETDTESEERSALELNGVSG